MISYLFYEEILIVGARSKEELNAVETVLNEFFVLEDDGCQFSSWCTNGDAGIRWGL